MLASPLQLSYTFREVNPTLKKTITKTFIQLLSDLKTEEQIEIFLRDFFDEKEFETYTKRLAIAYWIKKNRDDENIKNNLKVTEKEISEVKKTIDKKGIRLALKHLEADEWANVWAEKIKKLGNRD